MAKQWVDITTIDNNTPFMKVRWKSYFSSVGDSWFAESPGIVSDNMGWTDGDKDNGWFSAHRMNAGEYGPIYCCSFDFDHTMSGFWDEFGQTYQVSLKDGSRDQFYDTTVEIGGETYYEVDFSLWQDASGYQLYAPYSVMPWAPGDIYVEVGSPDITLNPTGVTFGYQGGSSAITVTAADDWSCSTPSFPWLSIDVTSGTSGTTVVTVSTNNIHTASTGTLVSWIEFSCNTSTVEFVARQTPPQLEPDKNSLKFKVTGGTSAVGITADLDWSASTSEQWLSISPASGTSATTGFTVSADTYTGGSADRTGTITVTDGLNTKTIAITQKYKEGADGLYLGLDDCEALYLGDTEVEALYIGGQQIF